jgi:iron complex transport system substrate-binding protein
VCALGLRDALVGRSHECDFPAGGNPLGPAPGARFADVTWDDIAALRPGAVVVAPCGFDLDRTVEAARPWNGRPRALAPRVLLMDGDAYLNRPGARLVEAAEKIAAFCHARRE